eukprot:6111308-Amphidinium_carterae.1
MTGVGKCKALKVRAFVDCQLPFESAQCRGGLRSSVRNAVQANASPGCGECLGRGVTTGQRWHTVLILVRHWWGSVSFSKRSGKGSL